MKTYEDGIIDALNYILSHNLAFSTDKTIPHSIPFQDGHYNFHMTQTDTSHLYEGSRKHKEYTNDCIKQYILSVLTENISND